MNAPINFKDISPFEVKNLLLETAGHALANKQLDQSSHSRVLNAGRGNPNFLNTNVRKAHALLTTFACDDAKANSTLDNIGMRPRKRAIAKRLQAFCENAHDQVSSKFLQQAISFVQAHDSTGANDAQQNAIVYDISWCHDKRSASWKSSRSDAHYKTKTRRGGAEPVL